MSEERHDLAYRAVALQVACKAVNRFTDPAEARAAMRRAIDGLAEQIPASLVWLGADTRLVVPQHDERGVLRYALAHDRMAEVVVRAVEEEWRHGALDVDPELLRLRQYVGIMARLYRAGEKRQAVGLEPERYARIEAHAEALLRDDERRFWWEACRQEQEHRTERLSHQLRSGPSPPALAALAALGAGQREIVREVFGGGARLAIFEQGPAGLADDSRDRVVLRAVERLVSYCETAPENLELLGVAVWALDRFPGRSESDETRRRAAAVRAAVLEPLRRHRPPPEIVADPLWAAIPGGTFEMGGDGEPRHRVAVWPFRMLVHPVTNRQYRRLVPEHEGKDELPVVGVDWYRSYAFAAWLGGRLPTEAEWEYAARAGCRHAYCDRHGKETTLDEVGWYDKNSGGKVHPVMQLEPNPWGLYDMYGNVWEWVADWYDDSEQTDPWGPASGSSRVIRGGSAGSGAEYVRAACRASWNPWGGSLDQGFRVVLPAAPSS